MTKIMEKGECSKMFGQFADLYITNENAIIKGYAIAIEIGDIIEVLYESGNTYNGKIVSMVTLNEVVLSITVELTKGGYRTFKATKILSYDCEQGLPPQWGPARHIKNL